MDFKIIFVVLIGLSCYAKNAESHVQKRFISDVVINFGLPILKEIVEWAIQSAKDVKEAEKEKKLKCGNRTMEHLPLKVKAEVDKELNWMAAKNIDPIWALRYHIYRNSIDDFAWKLEAAGNRLGKLHEQLYHARNVGRNDREKKLKILNFLRVVILQDVKEIRKIFERDNIHKLLAGLLPDRLGISDSVNLCTSKLIFIDDPEGNFDCVKSIQTKFDQIVEKTDLLSNAAQFGYKRAENYLRKEHNNNEFDMVYDTYLSETKGTDVSYSIYRALHQVSYRNVFHDAADLIKEFKTTQSSFLAVIIAEKLSNMACLDCRGLLKKGNLRNKIKHFNTTVSG